MVTLVAPLRTRVRRRLSTRFFADTDLGAIRRTEIAVSTAQWEESSDEPRLRAAAKGLAW
jgi:hypothetical protein